MTNMSDWLEIKLRHMRPSEQRFINAARQDRVFWRGEDIEHFKRVYEETMRMREIGVDAYRAEATKKLKALMRGMG